MKKEKGKRLYVEPSSSPSITIKTNLDDSTGIQDNPYYTSSMNHEEAEKFEEYFFEDKRKGEYHE
ncbi:hypothetical protein ACWE42_25055 [Sutcliffiella cohnii]|uniref:Uncharacterized protein n=1 Tax=Sutcliffiella cohnii TaxID=33932 RepID=A0A223KQJ8_9BACI|nr:MULTISPECIES: hypothetical protein [Sutcliffiella]AST91608.1 hypothetical protein BC6307_10095 [Sutcliffiella cohnii]MED4014812.1 hypothetical protein [Sutcliffiella cohnii]WBL17439.1 hypothetical protein O1A01_12750 [Sutcliffiella sp. NC1]